jgi:hypothetical protein
MIIIAHRGLLEGPNKQLENHPEQIEKAIEENFNVEVDLRVIDKKYFLGHDTPDFEVGEQWLSLIAPFTWFHCKNVDALLYLKRSNIRSVHYFWHEEDTLTLTNKGFIWVYPGKQPIKHSIAVMPELHNDDVSQCFGICTDYSYDYRKRHDT